jgi:hypothetical protein
MSNIPEEQPVSNRFTPDAQERIGRLRAMGAEFPDVTDPKPLTLGEIRIVRRTSVAALEKAALFAEATPGFGHAAELRDAIAFELAYGGVRDEALVIARRVDHAILRRKLKAVRAARGLYRMGKGYVTLDEGDPLKPYVREMGNALSRPRKRKSVSPPAETTEGANAAKK